MNLQRFIKKWDIKLRMISNNIILIIVILIAVGIIAYFYYNYKNSSSIPEDNHVVIQNDKKTKKNTKRVRFNKNVKYNTYKFDSTSDNNKKSDTSTSSYIFTQNGQSKIDVDSIFDSITSSDTCSLGKLDIEIDNNKKDDYSIIEEHTNISSGNHEKTEPEEMWDANFGLPLMNQDEKKKYIEKMKKNHKEYEKSLGQFTKYQMDNSTLIKTDITIDPFKPGHKSSSLKGKTVREIYDQQVAGPKPIPKKIKAKTANNIIYEDESELNGGVIKGTNLRGFDGINNGYKSAAFGNEF